MSKKSSFPIRFKCIFCGGTHEIGRRAYFISITVMTAIIIGGVVVLILR